MATSRRKRRSRVTGIRLEPPPASSNGFTITKSYYLLDGTEVSGLDTAQQNDRFVVMIDVTITDRGSGQYVISAPLPAGFEIENADMSGGRPHRRPELAGDRLCGPY